MLNAADAGTCTVTATKAADANYKVASSSATIVTFIGPIIIPTKPPKVAPKIPHALTVKFVKSSLALRKNFKKALNVLAKKLVKGASVTVRYYLLSNGSLAKSRAQVTAKFLRGRSVQGVTINLRGVKKRSPLKVTVVPTRN